MAWLCDVDVARNTIGLWHLEMQQYRKISSNMLRGPLHMHRTCNESKIELHATSDSNRIFRTSESYYHCFLNTGAVPSRPLYFCNTQLSAPSPFATASSSSSLSSSAPVPPPQRPPPPLSPTPTTATQSSQSADDCEWRERKRSESPLHPLPSHRRPDRSDNLVPRHRRSTPPTPSFAHMPAPSHPHVLTVPASLTASAHASSTLNSVSTSPFDKMLTRHLPPDTRAATPTSYVPPHVRAPLPHRPLLPAFILHHAS